MDYPNLLLHFHKNQFISILKFAELPEVIK